VKFQSKNAIIEYKNEDYISKNVVIQILIECKEYGFDIDKIIYGFMNIKCEEKK
jgi:hypothetical protein